MNTHSRVARCIGSFTVGFVLMMNVTTALAQTATPPSGTVSPHFSEVQIDTQLTVGGDVSLTNGQFYSDAGFVIPGGSPMPGFITNDKTGNFSVLGFNGFVGSFVRNAGTSPTGLAIWGYNWSDSPNVAGVAGTVTNYTNNIYDPSISATGILGYRDPGGALYGVVSTNDARVNGDLFLNGILFTNNITNNGTGHLDIQGDTNVNGTFAAANIKANGSVTASSIGKFISRFKSASGGALTIKASCDTGYILIACSGFNDGAAAVYKGAKPVGNECVAERTSSSGTLYAYAYCFNPMGT